MEEVREFLKTSLGDTIAEIQGESLMLNGGMHYIGRIRAIGTIEAWMNECGTTRESLFERVLREYQKLNDFIRNEEKIFENLEDADKDNFVFGTEHWVNEGKRYMFYESLGYIRVIEDEECEDDEE